MTVSILGCGWFGLPLAKTLLQEDNIVKGSTTSESKLDMLAEAGISPYMIRFDESNESFNPGFFDCDVLVVSIPPKIKSGQTENFLSKINSIIAAINQYSVPQVVYISTTGVYGDSGVYVDENTNPDPDTESGKLLLVTENLFKDQSAFKSTIVRFGGLVGPDRHPGRFFAGKKDIANGKAPVNLIHQIDAVGIVMAIIKSTHFGGVINACATDHPSRADFYRYAAAQGNYEIPEFIDELKGWKIVDSIRYSELGYKFKINNWLTCRF
jgi:nucleoside-diphosphate-sugar epimerase